MIFTVPESKILYLAGIYRPYGAEKRFVVLTREANASMAAGARQDAADPLSGGSQAVGERSCEADDILAKVLPMLKAERPYEQMTFEW